MVFKFKILTYTGEPLKHKILVKSLDTLIFLDIIIRENEVGNEFDPKSWESFLRILKNWKDFCSFLKPVFYY